MVEISVENTLREMRNNYIIIKFIIKSQELTTRGGGNLGVLLKLMNQNFSKSKFLHESTKLENFQWEVKILGVQI